ncbi:protein-L-isoaspartate O-methyltransferase family protein [Acidianus manzaensis]|uniref:protein-L-isoaspartate(D-aspartate) O-methyltransferase n=1 Tax=Acidianus manzaensis TaxID=282676 RepID=A0A1W6JYD6_9CREN|nr:protein-L-isoaspartate O-methyltransferase [Acidianus manzaensis]ARM75252.1 protein-L-isoaspartate O-methyltransferase [Acidianus manzaensis]
MEEIASRIKNAELYKAFLKVNREDFLPDLLKKYAYDKKYVDTPLQIIPEITTTALSLGIYMLDNLDLHKSQKVLEIGTGIGYYTALMAEIVDKVFSLEINNDMYNYAREKLKKYNNVEVIKADGTLGLEKEKPFDRIIVWAASPTIPCKLYEQLKEGGIMIVPIGTGKVQSLYKIIKIDENNPQIQKLTNVIFMKMKGIYGFYEDEEDDDRIERLEKQIKKLMEMLKEKI